MVKKIVLAISDTVYTAYLREVFWKNVFSGKT